MEHPQALTFDHYWLELPNEQLWQGNQIIPVPSKALAVLRYLVEHAGQVVTKGELFTALWPGIAVSDGALTFCIVELRKALGDKAKAPRFIETVHRRGYRFLPTVTPQPVQSSQFRVPSPTPQPSGLGTQHSLLVGREAELAQLHGWLEKALSGERQLVFVTGESGIGKTSVVDAFLQQVASRDLWLGRGQCIEQYGAGEPYMPILEALGRLCREPEGGQLIALLNQYAPTWLVQMPTLLHAAELEALQRKTAGATRERMLREMGEAVEAITAARPLVLWLEDLHWSDASTLELLALLARRREQARLLVIGTYRPVDVIVREHPLRAVKQELQFHGLCAELPLRLLSETQVVEYLEQRISLGAHGRAPPHALAQMIHRRTDGNPLFMVTTVDDLIGQHLLIHREGQWSLPAEPTAIEPRVPDTLQQLMERQIERLNTEERRVLEVASVAGMEFSAAAVAAGLATEVEAVEEWCAGLAHQERFVRANGAADWPDGTIAARHSFLHALYQEVLYKRLPAARRRRLHQRIGERAEQAYGERAQEIAAELAVHFERGHDYHKAVQYLHQAGENALRRLANREAIAHLSKGLALLTTLPETPARRQQELTLQVTLSAPLVITQGYSAPEVKATYDRAWELCRELGETPQHFFVLLGLSRFYVVRSEF